jgi:biopolymer transport protein TolR
MAFSSERSGDAISQINVTPLVDVMLVLLVIFMVTAPILQQGVSVNLPRVEAGPIEGNDEQLVVTVTAREAVVLNDAPMTLSDLQAKLRGIISERPDRKVFLRADTDVRYGQVMKVLSSIRQAGVQKLGMVTEPPPER